MSKRSILAKTVAVAALSASLVGITAGTASARPSCDLIFDFMAYAADNSFQASNAGRTSEALFWGREYRSASQLYRKSGCGTF